jgi:hypothetical protein
MRHHHPRSPLSPARHSITTARRVPMRTVKAGPVNNSTNHNEEQPIGSMKIRVVTVATQGKNPASPHTYFEQFKASWRKPFPTTGMKLKYLEEYLATHKDFEWLIFCDALDTVTSCAPETLVEKFLFHFDDETVVVSAERNCFPFPELAAKYPSTKSPYKYLNSGLYMGRRESVMANLALMDAATKYSVKDQGTWTDAYLRKLTVWYPIVLDNKCRLFQSLHGSLDDVGLDRAGNIVNKHTLTTPLVFHGNGSTPMDKILKWLKL